MRRLWAPAAAAAFALAFAAGCTGSGGGCAGDSSNSNSGEATPMAAGGGGGSRGSLSEPVSFQGLGAKKAPPPTQAAAPSPGGATAGAASVSGKAAPDVTGGAQSLLCGGFPDLPPDCKTSPLFKAIRQKCCPDGTVERCEAIPGGARLIGRGCRPAAP
ncbi:MAG: hypothetical protein KGM24_13350 [Elusimicrobia bacterium]|nr:hypothetical protein [Elusimicrobiota bacterium]